MSNVRSDSMAPLAESAAVLYGIADALPNPISDCDRNSGHAAYALADPYALRALPRRSAKARG